MFRTEKAIENSFIKQEYGKHCIMVIYYKPDQRVVNVEILTWKYWISGGIHIGKMNKFLDVINNTSNFLKIVDAEFESGQKWPFLGLQHNAVEVIIPREDRENIIRKDIGQSMIKRVVCLLPEREIEGEFHILPDVRVSDFLSNAKNYIPIHNLRIDTPSQNGNTESTTVENVPTALINKQNVIGVTDI